MNIPHGLLNAEFEREVAVYEKLRGVEFRMNDFIEQKMASMRQDMLISGRQQAQLKRWMEMRLTVDSGDRESNERKWSLKLQGKLMNGMTDDELKAGAASHMMGYFDRIKVEFADNAYEAIEWVKSSDKAGSSYDAFEVARPYAEDGLKPVSGTIFITQVHHPKRFRLSPVL